MQFLVISYTVLAFFVVVIALSFHGRKMDDKQRRIDYINGLTVKATYAELEKTFFQRFISPVIKKITKIFENAMPKQKQANKNKKTEIIEKQLRLAGIYMEPQEFSFIKTIVLLLSMIIGVLLFIALPIDPMLSLLVLLVFAIVGIIGPTFFLKSRVGKHQGGIRNQLPDAMDLLGVCIEAGLSFDSALLKVAEKLEGPFINELLIVYREIQMGRPRREALQHLSEATEIQELKTFASALAQAEQLGIPINNVMRVQSVQLRATRREMAKEKGMKAPIKMMLPMVAFIFPALLIILMGPTVLTMIEQFM